MTDTYVLLNRIAVRVDSQAAISSRPGQLDDLEQIAQEIRDIARELRDGVR